MTTMHQIKRFSDAIVREFAPERVVLFGSYASGRAYAESDIDLFVVMEATENFTDQALEIRRRISCDFPVDIIVRSPDEIRRRLKDHDQFLINIFAEGKTLYERRGARVD